MSQDEIPQPPQHSGTPPHSGTPQPPPMSQPPQPPPQYSPQPPPQYSPHPSSQFPQPQAHWNPAGPPMAAPPVGPTNSFAIAALVASLTLPPLGILFGHIASAQIKRTGENGRGLAVAGLILGYLFTSIMVVSWTAIAIFFSRISDDLDAAGSLDSYPATTAALPFFGTHTSAAAPGDETTQAILDASVGSCIHRVIGTSQGNGSSNVTVSAATCGTSYATDRVVARTTDTAKCNGSWVRTSGSAGTVVLCLVPD